MTEEMEKEIKQCQNCKNSFTVEPEDFEFYNKISVPPPTFCPDCRTQRRMTFRNERALYKRKCNAPEHTEEILSMYSSDKDFNIVDKNYWWSDGWDPLSYGNDYDFSKSFFQQYKELYRKFPLQALSNSNTVNSDYCNVNNKSKDCYLISASFDNEGIMYSNRITNNKDSLDLYVVQKSNLCYEDVSSKENYKVFFSLNTFNCADSYFLYDCRNCTNCFGCSNLRNKQYHIFNQPHSKEEYEKKLEEFDLGSFKNLSNTKEGFKKIYLKAIHKYANLLKAFDVLGDNISNAKNCLYCFDITDGAENSKYCTWGGINIKDSYDSGPGVGVNSDLLYETFDSGIQSSKIFATNVVYGSHDVKYSYNCHSSSNLFGCIGLRNKQYCILNKQYTPESYQETVNRIKEQMDQMPYIDKKGRVYKYGEFFPPEISPFAYNETIAQEYFPLTKEQALEQGYSWKEPEQRQLTITLNNNQIPDHIKDVTDDITKEIIECEHKGECNEQCTTAFKIIPQELEFYRKLNLPLPTLCPNCRHYQRIKQRNPLKLWKRQCNCQGSYGESNPSASSGQANKYQNTSQHSHGDQPCLNEFETTYAPDRPEIVYCEQCYQQEVI